MNVPFLVAAVLAVAAAAIHGIVGEIIVVRRIPTDSLPKTRFGPPGATAAIVRVAWHICTAAFAVAGVSLASCAGGGAEGACVGVGRVSAAMFGAFVLVAFAVVGPSRFRRSLIRHQAPLAFAAIAVLAWIGSG